MKKISKSQLVLFFFTAFYTLTFASEKSLNFSANQDKYSYQLEQLNYFLKDFNDGYYGYIEVVDGYIVIRFRDGNYSKFKIENMAAPEYDTTWDQITWDCKNESLCVETDWNDEGKESGILFSELGSYNMNYLYDLLNSFISAYKRK